MYIRVKVIPNAKKEYVESEGENRLIISVKEKPEQNMANHRVRELLAARLDKKIGDIKLISGHHHRIKMFSVKE